MSRLLSALLVGALPAQAAVPVTARAAAVIALLLGGCSRAPFDHEEIYSCSCMQPDGGVMPREYRFTYCNDSGAHSKCAAYTPNALCCTSDRWEGCGAVGTCDCATEAVDAICF